MIGIIGAMAIETQRLCAMTENKEIYTISGVDYITGTLLGKEVVIAQCGIGKVFAAVCAQTMIMKFSPDVIINTGVAGALDCRLSPGDIVVSKDVVQYDMDTSPLGDPVGMISGINIIHIPCKSIFADEICAYANALGINAQKGTIASADRFLCDQTTKNEIHLSYGAIACDMESGSIGQVCYINRTDLIIIRSISDSADGSSAMDYNDFLELAAENSCAVSLEFIKNR